MWFLLYVYAILICLYNKCNAYFMCFHFSWLYTKFCTPYIFWQHPFINTNFIEYNGHFLSTYFLVDPFILPYWFYSIRRELIDIFSIIVYFPSTFCLTLSHHQGRMYYKSEVTFLCTLLLCKKSICTIFLVFGMTQPGTEPQSPGPLANMLTIIPIFHISIWKYFSDEAILLLITLKMV